MGENIAFGTGGAGYLAGPAKGAGPAVLVIPDRRSAPGHARDLCDRLAAEGFTALAPDLDDPPGPDDLDAAVDVLGPHPAVRGRGIAVVGFALGGSLALWLTTHRPGDVVAAVVFDGVVPAGDEPPVWERVTAPVQGHFGEDDPAFPPSAVSALEESLAGAGVSVELFGYPAAGSGFFDDTRPEGYVEDAARQAWIRSLEFLRKHVG